VKSHGQQDALLQMRPVVPPMIAGMLPRKRPSEGLTNFVKTTSPAIEFHQMKTAAENRAAWSNVRPSAKQ